MRKVTYVKLHDLNVVVPGLGTVQGSFPPVNKTIPGLEMYLGKEPGVLTIKAAGGEFGIPLANVQFMHFEKESPAPASLKAVSSSG